VDFFARLDPELEEAVRTTPPLDLSGDLPSLRAAQEAAMAPLLAAAPPVPEVESEDHLAPGLAGGPDVPVRVYRRRDGQAPTAGLVWIHGGGMVFGSVAGDDPMCRAMARSTGCAIASVEYRLAPEHQYPAHVDDCYAALAWFASEAERFGVDPARVAIGGASAGGGIAAGTALLARDRGKVALCWQMLVFPMIDDLGATVSGTEIEAPQVWNREANRHGWAAYLGERAGGDDVPLYAAPARATVEQLRGLPPAYLDVGELDPFRDEDLAYAAKLLQAGVPTELHVTPGVFHASESRVLGAASSKRIRGYRRDALQRALGPR
jgi:acetyl esterase/lipase